MKLTPLVIAGSVATNVVLGGLLLATRTRPAATEMHAPPPATTTAVVVPEVAVSPPRQAPRAALPQLGSSEIRAADFSALAASLQEDGYPPDVVKLLVSLLIDRHFKERGYATIRPKSDPAEYWTSGVIQPSAEERVARRKLEREQEAMARAVFGLDYNMSPDRAASLFAGISPGSAEKMKRLFADYKDLENDIRDTWAPGEDIGAKLALLEKEKRADLERILSQEELHAYDLRHGAVSGNLRNHFGSFQPTEAEFLALYPIAQEIFPRDLPMRMTREARQEQQARLDQAVRRVLGETRYAEFEQTRRPPFGAARQAPAK